MGTKEEAQGTLSSTDFGVSASAFILNWNTVCSSFPPWTWVLSHHQVSVLCLSLSLFTIPLLIFPLFLMYTGGRILIFGEHTSQLNSGLPFPFIAFMLLYHF